MKSLLNTLVMISGSILLLTSTSTSYAQPLYYQESNTYYPTTYNIYADVSKQEHQVTQSDFVLS